MADPYKGTANPMGRPMERFAEGTDPLGFDQKRQPRYNIARSAFDRPDAESQKAELAERLRGVDARGVPLAKAAGLGSASAITGARVETGREDEFRARQQALAGQLGEMAAGRGPSAAGMQLQAGLDRSLAQQMSAAGSAQGATSSGLAARLSAQQGASMTQDVQQQMAQARVQEQMGALGQLGGVVSAGRGADQATALAQAGFGQQASLANQAAFNQFALQRAGMEQQTGLANQMATLQAQGMSDAQARFYLQSKMGISSEEMQGAMAREKLAVDQNLAQQKIDAASYEAAQGRKNAFIGGVFKTIGSLGMSDETKKTDIDKGEDDDMLQGALLKGAMAKSPIEAKTDVAPGGESLAAFFKALGAGETGSAGNALLDMVATGWANTMAENMRPPSGGSPRSLSPVEAKKDVSPARHRLADFYSALDTTFGASESPMHGFADLIAGAAETKRRADRESEAGAARRTKKTPKADTEGGTGYKKPEGRDPIEVMDKVDRERELAKRLKAEEDKILFRERPGDWTRPEAAAPPTAPAWPGGAPLLAGNPAWGETAGFTPMPDTSGKDVAAAIEAQARLLNAASPPPPMSGPSLSQYQQALGLRRADAPRSPTRAVSDRDAKRSVGSEASREAFLDALQAHEYRYKEPDAPGAGHGRFVSPMAQELEQTSLGRSAVVETPDGDKMVDYGKLGGIMLAGQADLHHRMTELEAALNKRRASARKVA